MRNYPLQAPGYEPATFRLASSCQAALNLFVLQPWKLAFFKRAVLGIFSEERLAELEEHLHGHPDRCHLLPQGQGRVRERNGEWLLE